MNSAARSDSALKHQPAKRLALKLPPARAKKRITIGPSAANYRRPPQSGAYCMLSHATTLHVVASRQESPGSIYRRLAKRMPIMESCWHVRGCKGTRSCQACCQSRAAKAGEIRKQDIGRALRAPLRAVAHCPRSLGQSADFKLWLLLFGRIFLR